MSRPDDGGLPGDPFWDVVQTRHPDVDIVILPNTPPVRVEPAPPLDAAGAERVAAELDAVFAELWPLVTAEPPPDGAVHWAGAPTAARPVRAAVLEIDAAETLVETAEAVLTARGWQVERLPGALARVRGREGDLEVVASGHDGVLRLEVRGAEAALDRRLLHELREVQA